DPRPRGQRHGDAAGAGGPGATALGLAPRTPDPWLRGPLPGHQRCVSGPRPGAQRGDRGDRRRPDTRAMEPRLADHAGALPALRHTLARFVPGDVAPAGGATRPPT